MKGVYLMGGYPDRKTFLASCAAVRDADFDFIEVGLPYNDPAADGPVIASAHREALDMGIRPSESMEAIKEAERIGLPLYVMCYANTIFARGIDAFSSAMTGHLRGAIVPDLPLRHHDYFRARGFDIPLVPFVTLETPLDDMTRLSRHETDFIYFIGLRGVTGQDAEFGEELRLSLERLRSAVSLKVLIGFGIKTPAHARTASALADGFVVGTEAVRRQGDPDALRRYLSEFA